MKLYINQWPIRYKILALVAAPLILTATLITLYHTFETFEQDKESIRSSSERLLAQAANAGQLAFFAEDTRSLNNLAKSLMVDPQITSVHFFDENKSPIPHDFSRQLNIGMAPFSDGDHFLQEDQWFFVKAVHYTEEGFSDDPEQELQGLDGDEQEQKPIGWITIAIDLRQSEQEHRNILINNLMITTVTTVIAFWLAIQFARTITTPLRKITQAVEHYSKHDFNHRLPEVSDAELGQLEKGINNLALQVSESQQTLENAIDKVRSQWIEAVEDLELKNNDLISARIRAEEANKAKDDFLARMSHELRTPLTAIMGFVGILDKTEQPQTRKEYIEMILATSSVLLSTINDILDFSKLKSNTFKLSPSHFNLEHLLRNILDMHSVSANKKGIELNLMIDSDVPLEIEVDFDKLKKVLNNIVANAIKFTDFGDIVVFISKAQDNDGQPLIAIEVKDSGSGIAPGELDHLFDPFYQCDESSTRQYEGTGLGLSIAKDFVELMGGSIQVDSEPGEGTEVRFTFAYKTTLFDGRSTQQQQDLSAYLFDLNAWTKRAWRNILLKITRNVYAPHSFEDLLEVLPMNDSEGLLLMGYDLRRNSEHDLQRQLQQLRNVYQGPIVLALSEQSNLDNSHYEINYFPIVMTRKPLTQSRLTWALDQLNQGATQAPLDVLLNPTPEPQLPMLGEHFAAKTQAPGQPPAQHLAQPQVQSQAQARPLDKLSILLAEDNLFNQRLFKDLLEAAGANVKVTEDGQLAYDAAQKTRYDLLILDLHMPKLDGIEAGNQIRSGAGQNQSTPIMLLTADILTHQEDDLDALGIDAICHKPIDETHFLETIASLCQRRAPKTTIERSLLTLDPKDLREEVERQLGIIQQDINNSNMEGIKSQVHQLAGIIGLSKLSYLDEPLSHLNQSIVEASLTDIETHFEQLANHWQKNRPQN